MRRSLMTGAALSIAVALVVVGLITSDGSSSTTTTSRVRSVPTFRGLTLGEARALARRRDGRVYVVLRAPSSAPAGTVLSQEPNSSWPVGLVVSSGRWANDDAILPGERQAPLHPACAVAVALEQDGNVFPLSCSGDRVNVGAWLFYARNRPSMMSLARSTPFSRVLNSLCHYRVGDPVGFNLTVETLPEQESVFTLAAIYNGWRIPKNLDCASSRAAPH